MIDVEAGGKLRRARRGRRTGRRRSSASSSTGDFGGGVEEAEAQAERVAGQGQHAAELPAAEDADSSWLPPAGRGGRGRPASARAVTRRAPSRNCGCLPAEDGGRQQGRVDGAGPADGQRADRDAGRHLHDRQQRVDARAAPSTRPARRGRAGASWRRPCPAGGRPRRRRR